MLRVPRAADPQCAEATKDSVEQVEHLSDVESPTMSDTVLPNQPQPQPSDQAAAADD